MKTDQATHATPEAVCSTAMLGPMVERIGSPPDTHCWDDDSAADCWSYSPQMVAELLDAAVAAERARLRVMLTAHLDQTVMSHHVTLAECHAARNALQLALDQWA